MCFGGGNNDTKVYCSNCGKKTSQTFNDCWDADVGDDNNRKWSDKHNGWLYRQIAYYSCNKCGTENTKESWHYGSY